VDLIAVRIVITVLSTVVSPPYVQNFRRLDFIAYMSLTKRACFLERIKTTIDLIQPVLQIDNQAQPLGSHFRQGTLSHEY
jgi:hypothetical protein